MSLAVTLGEVTIEVERPKHEENVPNVGKAKEYGYDLPLPELLNHLQWMMKKLKLGQDIFLIGPPGPVRRWLAFLLAKTLRREIEYQSLTSDTTESDLKQRREIRGKTIHYVDQAAVRAALEGRILILDGIEKCERNVLPILNNLLENREMHLEDGRFLVSPKRFAHLAQKHSKDELARLRLVAVHPKFQVIALGLPVPKFEGNALDPPLRSRFQARNVAPLSEETQLSLISSLFPSLLTDSNNILTNDIRTPGNGNQGANLISQLVVFAEALQRIQHSEEGALIPRLLQLPPTALVDFCQLHIRFPSVSNLATLLRLYPYFAKSNEAERKAIEAALTTVGWMKGTTENSVQLSSPFSPSSSPSIGSLQKDSVLHSAIFDNAYSVVRVDHIGGENRDWKITFESKANDEKNRILHVLVNGGFPDTLQVRSTHPFVETTSAKQLISAILQDFALSFDVCIIGDQGSGKTQLISQISNILRYEVQTMQMYKDMTSRDLLQKRTTNASGDTVWQNSPLVKAAINGNIAVLDGIHRLASGTLTVLATLLQDREVSLYDGSRLVRPDTFEFLSNKMRLNSKQMNERGIFMVHPAFRIVATANFPERTKQWLNSEIVSLFHFHLLNRITIDDKFDIVQILFPGLRGKFEKSKKNLIDNSGAPAASQLTGTSKTGLDRIGNNENLQDACSKLHSFVHSLNKLRNQKTDTDESGNADSDIPIYSLRQLIRTCKRMEAFPADLAKMVENILLFKFFPMALKESVGNVLVSCGIPPHSPISPNQPSNATHSAANTSLKISVSNNFVSIGSVQVKRHVPTNPALVPRIVFFEMTAHTILLQDMLKDWSLGEHMLLIGNQGVGKNVLVDHMLQILRLEREYIQLHRDTTVQTLTLAPSIVNGVVVWEDSALVRAVQHGRVLVIDEADKAPLEVVCILKGLIEDGEMILADGRRICRISGNPQEVHRMSQSQSLGPHNPIVPMHPDFRMIVLANRPGFPFLGNNFFRECGDCFSVHVVDNPDRESELRLLRSYAPNVDFEVLDRLVSLFGDLRDMVEQGQLTYPYSLRELVNIAKHMEAYPGDSLLQGIDNVFHFDQYDTIVKEHLTSIFQKHGLPVGGYFNFTVKLAEAKQLPNEICSERWSINTSRPLTSSISSTEVSITPLTQKGEWKSPTGALNAEFKLRAPPMGRLKTFREEKLSFAIESNGVLEGATCGKDGTIYVLTSRPLQLIAFAPKSSYRSYRIIRLSDHLTTHHPRYSSDRGVSTKPTNISTLKNGDIMVFIAQFHMILVIDPHSDTITPYELPSASPHFSVFGKRAYIAESLNQSLLRTPSEYSSSSVRLILIDSLAMSEGLVVIPRMRGSDFYYVDFLTKRVGYAVLPVKMQIISMHLLSRTVWLVTGHNNTRIFVVFRSDALETFDLVETQQTVPSDFNHAPMNQHTFYAPNCKQETVLNHELTHLQRADASLSKFASSGLTPAAQGTNCSVFSTIRPLEDLKTTVATLHLQEAELMVNLCFEPPPDLSVEAVRTRQLSKSSALKIQSDEASMVLEVIDLKTRMTREIKIKSSGSERIQSSSNASSSTFSPFSSSSSSSNMPLSSIVNTSISGALGYIPKVVRVVSIVPMNTNGEILVLGDDGRVSIFELESSTLTAQLKKWNRIVGNVGQKKPNHLALKSPNPNDLRLTFEYDKGAKANGQPKFGEFDGKFHKGGSNFAGGQGGANTSGMGGAGGPSRLDIGEGDIYQVSDQVKSQVDAKSRQAARAMAQQMLNERLAAIEMSELDSTRYDQMLSEMKPEIRQLRAVLEAASAKGKERNWLKNRTSGELDDGRLVDGLVGEKNVFKARGKQKPLDGSPQNKPKRMRFVMDVSGSMARFNGTDRRLERLLQCTLMIMEGLRGFEHKFSYSIVGHSGDSPEIDFVEYDKPPMNKKERLSILDKMTAHAAHCTSGDYTVKATELAVRNVTKIESDEYFVFVFSDANLGRYGIKPASIKDELIRDRRVGAYILFIASAGDDAQKIKTELPLGKAYVCLDTASLPITFKQIFASSATQND